MSVFTPVYDCRISFSPYEKDNPYRDMVNKDFYIKGYHYFLTNGANPSFTPGGAGTNLAITDLARKHEIDYFDIDKLKTIEQNGEFGNIVGDDGVSLKENTPYFLDDSAANKQIIGVFHVIGKNFSQENDPNKARKANIDAVVDYYTRIIKAVNEFAKSNSDKFIILYLARIPGNIFKGGIETVIGMLKAINSVKQENQVGYQIDVSSELYYLLYDDLFYSTPDPSKALVDEFKNVENEEKKEDKKDKKLAKQITDAFNRSEKGVPFIYLYVNDEDDNDYKEIFKNKNCSVIILTIEEHSVKYEFPLKIDLLNNDQSERDKNTEFTESKARIRMKDFKITCEKNISLGSFDILIFKLGKYNIIFTKNKDKLLTQLKIFFKSSVDILEYLQKDSSKTLLNLIDEKKCQYERDDLSWFIEMRKKYRHFNLLSNISHFFKKDYKNNLTCIEDLLGKTDMLKKSKMSAIIFYKDEMTVYFVERTPSPLFLYFVKIDNVTFLIRVNPEEDDYFGLILNGSINPSDGSKMYKFKYDVLEEKRQPELKLKIEEDEEQGNTSYLIETQPQTQPQKMYKRVSNDTTLTPEILAAIVTSDSYGIKRPLLDIDPNTDCNRSPSLCVDLYTCILCGNKFPSWDPSEIKFRNEDLDDEYKASYGCKCPIKLYVLNLHECTDKGKEKLKKYGDGDIVCFNGFDDIDGKMSFYTINGKNIELSLNEPVLLDGIHTLLVDIDIPSFNLQSIVDFIKSYSKSHFQIIFIADESRSYDKIVLRSVKLTNKHPFLPEKISMMDCTEQDPRQMRNFPHKGRNFSYNRAIFTILYTIAELRNSLVKEPLSLFRKKTKSNSKSLCKKKKLKSNSKSISKKKKLKLKSNSKSISKKKKLKLKSNSKSISKKKKLKSRTKSLCKKKKLKSRSISKKIKKSMTK